jgi:uncharacterized protein (DUF697 family)
MTTEAVADHGTKQEEAESIVKRNVLWAAGIGAVAIPIVDVVGTIGVQMKLLKELGTLYDVPFSENLGKTIVTSLLAGLGVPRLAFGAVGSAIKSIPGIGSIFGALSVSVFSAAVTYAVGKVFIQHFESGGTFLTFDPAKVKQHFSELYAEGSEVAKEATEA